MNDSHSIDPTSRRAFMQYFTTAGLSTTLLPGVLWSRSAGAAGRIDANAVKEAAALSDLEFTDEECADIAKGLRSTQRTFEKIREEQIVNSEAPAFHFDPRLAGMNLRYDSGVTTYSAPPALSRPSNLEDCAYWPITHLAELIRTRQVTSSELTEMYLARLKRVNESLNAVVTFTEERARAEATKADEAIAAGNYRGILHGIPYGVKDIFAAKGYPTTWGAKPYRDQKFEDDSTVVERLTQAGAVLVAKLSTGALAQGDRWYGGRTNNPWDIDEGSSGSSAGPASAIAAGGVGFAIGSETQGSIVSPSGRCGATGLRPTFGRISRRGCMALSWTMDKVGPMCRYAEDCAAVFETLQGPDGHDDTVVEAPFVWDATRDVKDLHLGIAVGTPDDDMFTSAMMIGLGAGIEPVQLPEMHAPISSMILMTEAAAAFDRFTRSNMDDELSLQGTMHWPNTFRTHRMVPAVEYIQAQRVRRRLMAQMDDAMKGFDVVVVSPSNGNISSLTNLTGHPMIAFPGPPDADGKPTARALLGRLYGEADLMLAAKTIQDILRNDDRHPAL